MLSWEADIDLQRSGIINWQAEPITSKWSNENVVCAQSTKTWQRQSFTGLNTKKWEMDWAKPWSEIRLTIIFKLNRSHAMSHSFLRNVQGSWHQEQTSKNPNPYSKHRSRANKTLYSTILKVTRTKPFSKQWIVMKWAYRESSLPVQKLWY